MLIFLCFGYSFVYALENLFSYEIVNAISTIEERAFVALILVIIVVIFWIVLAVNLLKHESQAVSINLSHRYKKLSLEKYGIDSNEFEKMIFNKFKEICVGFSNSDFNKLKENLTDDLYRSYVEQLELMKFKKIKNIVKEFELIDIKVYNINDISGNLYLDVYLNVRMIDYLVSSETDKLIGDSNKEKMDFEFELTFIRNKRLNNNYFLSKRNCINKMKVFMENVNM